MPIYKYKTFEAAERALWNFQPDQAYYIRILKLFEFARALNHVHYPKGIFKYRSLEEANKQREEWELEHAKQILRRTEANRCQSF